MPQQASANPTLPQNDTPAEKTARENQLTATQQVYVWSDSVPTLPEVPVVKTLPDAELPTLEWFLKLLEVLLDITKNAIAYDLAQVGRGLAAVDPILLDGERLVVAEAEKYLQQHTVSGVEEALIDAVIAELKNHCEKLSKIIERRTTQGHANGSNARSLENYYDVFETISLPEIAYTFQDDLEFARLRVAGPNSVLIEAVPNNEVPAKCAISAEQYANIVPNDTLATALEQGRIFQCDYKDLASIEPGAWGSKAKYLTCPVALFAVPPQSGSLVPIAINCDPSNPASPVITPSTAPDKQWGWQMAKFCVQAADGNYHELYAHLARTHLVTEAVAVA
ncbi:MAG: lipoxygenase family protein, partial [Pseudomonadota bacterium]